MTTRSWVVLAIREFRGSTGRLGFFALCLSVGVAAIVAVAGLATALDSGIQTQARQLLAADVELRSRRPIPSQALDAIATIPGADRADLSEKDEELSSRLKGFIDDEIWIKRKRRNDSQRR